MSGETYAGTSGSGARAGIWSAIVLLDSADVSARVVGDLRIDAEEDSAQHELEALAEEVRHHRHEQRRRETMQRTRDGERGTEYIEV